MSVGGFARRTLYWTNDAIHGSPVRKQYRDIQRVLGDHRSGKFIQRNHLDALLDHMSHCCSYYAQYRGASLAEFPVVDKNILNANKKDMSVDPDRIPGQSGPVHIQKTSGSTGTPLAVPQDTRKRNRRVAELKYFNTIIGVKSHEPIGQCRIWTRWQTKGALQSFRENIVPINVSVMDEVTIHTIVDTVQKHKCIMLKGYASWFTVLCRYLEKHPQACDKLASLRVCLSGSEALPPDTRERIGRLLGIPVVEQYADEEAGLLAQQFFGHEDRGYMLNSAGYVFECLKMDSEKPVEYGQLGRIVITDLFNYAFPLIRYDTGDTAIFSCGNELSQGWPYISALYGRSMDLVYDTSGRPLHPMNFARVLKNLPGIIQWQFNQRGEKDYTVRLNMEHDADVSETISEIHDIVGPGADIRVEYVHDIPVLASGKQRPVVCTWKHKA